jgi:hypothetical protein
MQSLGSCEAKLTDYKPIFKAAMGMRKKTGELQGVTILAHRCMCGGKPNRSTSA